MGMNRTTLVWSMQKSLHRAATRLVLYFSQDSIILRTEIGRNRGGCKAVVRHSWDKEARRLLGETYYHRSKCTGEGFDSETLQGGDLGESRNAYG